MDKELRMYIWADEACTW